MEANIKDTMKAYLKQCEILHQQHKDVPKLLIYQGPPDTPITTQKSFAEILSSLLGKPIPEEEVSINTYKLDSTYGMHYQDSLSPLETQNYLTFFTYSGEGGYFKSFRNEINFYSPYYIENKEFKNYRRTEIIIGLIALAVLIWLLLC